MANRHKPNNKKKPCATCTHGIAIHHPQTGVSLAVQRQPCWFPGCKCKDYKLLRKSS